MEENKQWKQLPFTIELAKKIQSGEIEGKIVTDKGASARILCYDFKCGEYNIGAAISVRDGERFCCITNSGLRSTGEQMNDGWFDKLFIELPEEEVVLTPSELQLVKETPKHKFKPFDKVLVRDNNGENWVPDIFRYYDNGGNYDYPYRCCANDYRQCIPYTGNEHLLGTSNNPK